MWSWDGLKYCVLKAEPGSEYKKAVECSGAFRKCSPGICVLQSLDCPVTKMRIEGGNVETEIVEGELPVIDLTITPNDIACFRADHFAGGPVAPYIFINENEKGCGEYGLDYQHSFKLDAKKQKELFGENDFPEEVMNLVGYKSVYEKTDSVLSYRKRLNVAEKDLCLDISPEILEKSSKAAKDLAAFFEDFFIGVSICHIFVIFSVFFLFGYSRKQENPWFATFSELRKTHDIGGLICFYTLLATMEYIGMGILFGVTTHYWVIMNGTRGYLERLNEEGCFLDWQAKTAVSNYHVVNVLTENVFIYCLAMFLLWTLFSPILFYLPYKAVRKS